MLQDKDPFIAPVTIKKNNDETYIHVLLDAFYIERNKIDISYKVSTYECSH